MVPSEYSTLSFALFCEYGGLNSLFTALESKSSFLPAVSVSRKNITRTCSYSENGN